MVNQAEVTEKEGRQRSPRERGKSWKWRREGGGREKHLRGHVTWLSKDEIDDQRAEKRKYRKNA